MGIVIITIPGESKRAFANSLHKLTGGKVDLVVIQKPKPNHHSLFQRLKRLYKSVGLRTMPVEIFYASLLRLNGSTRRTLEYFRERSGIISSIEHGYIPKTMEVVSANSEEVLNALRILSPDLIVIWGNTIIKPQIIKTAKRAINLHMGLCPYYRGAIANQYAVIERHPAHIGATIHYAEERVDAGDILTTITVDTSKPPQALFRELNDRAEKCYLDIASRLFAGKNISQRPQDISQGKNFILKNWTPRTRYNLAKQLRKWEETGVLY
ncbi:MAG: formyltransferase family protein [Patescibacteria group bacterium]|nr:formyltransferase family protein [Patescibacteria group bacterium]